MSHDAVLERRYRRLLRVYSAGYRAERGEEILGTLLETARPGQTRPTAADTMDLFAGGIRQRLGLNQVPGLAAGMAVAGPVALVLAASVGVLGLSVYWWARTAGALDSPSSPGDLWLPVVLWGLWPVAALVRAAAPRAVSRWVSGAAMLVTALITAMAAVGAVPRLNLWTCLGLFLTGLVAFAGTVHPAGYAERIGIVAGTAAAGGALLVAPGNPLYFYAGEGSRAVGLLQAVVLVGLALTGVARYVAGADTRSLWAAVILLVPVAPAVATLTAYESGWPPPNAPLALVLAAALLAGRVMAASPRPARPVSTDGGLCTAAVLATGFMLGTVPVMVGADLIGGHLTGMNSLYALLATVWLLVAVGGMLLPRWVARPIAVLAVALSAAGPAFLPAVPAGAGWSVARMFAPAALIAVLAAPATRRRGTGWRLTAVALTTLTVTLAALPGSEGGAVAFTLLTDAVATAGVVAGWRAARGGRRWIGTATLLTATLWLGGMLWWESPWLRALWWLPSALLAVAVAVLAYALPRRRLQPAAG